MKQNRLTILAMIFGLLLVASGPLASIAQSNLSTEEINFLRSLRGKWSTDPHNDCPEKWGSSPHDLSILFINNILKIEYASDWYSKTGPINKQIVTAYYSPSEKSVSFTYKVSVLGKSGWENPEITTITIPYQEDITDLFIAKKTFAKGAYKYSKEVIFYKY